jgi:hypothetical protein
MVRRKYHITALKLKKSFLYESLDNKFLQLLLYLALMPTNKLHIL